MRRRVVTRSSSAASGDAGHDDDDLASTSSSSSLSSSSSSSSSSSPPSFRRSLALVAAVLLSSLLAYAATYRTTAVVPASASADVFSEERARVHINDMLRIGPSMTGTKANDRMASLIETKMRAIAAAAPAHVDVVVEVQRVSGSMPFDILEVDVTNVYTNVTNVLMRISFPRAANRSGLAHLVNAHFDSAIGADGISDDRAAVAALLEAARALIATPAAATASFRHDVIIMANGAEESLQMASHGFTQKHRWAADVASVHNCDSTGSAGPQLMFQSLSAESVRSYSAGATHPHGNSIGADLFALGLPLGDTDFRIFRDFLPVLKHGVDAVLYREGWSYHTKLDNDVEAGSIQDIGDNVVGVAREVLAASYLDDERHVAATAAAASDDGSGRAEKHVVGAVRPEVVFFDVLRLRIFVIDMWLARVLSVLLIASVVRRVTLADALHGVRCLLTSVVATVAFGAMTHFTAPMLYFREPLLALLMYAPVSVAAAAASGTTSARLRGLYVVLLSLSVIFSLGSMFLVAVLLAAAAFPVGGLSVVCLQLFVLPILLTIIDLFVPITGRMGAGAPGDVVVAFIVGLFAFFALAGVVVRVRSPVVTRRLVGVSLLVFVVLAATTTTPFSPTCPKRLYVQHAARSGRSSSLRHHPLLEDTPLVHMCYSDGHWPTNEVLGDIIGALEWRPIDLDAADMDGVAPFNYFLRCYVADAPPLTPVAWGLTATSPSTRALNGNRRRVEVRVEHGKAEMVTLRFEAARVVEWTLDAPLVSKRAKGVVVVGHLGLHGRAHTTSR